MAQVDISILATFIQIPSIRDLHYAIQLLILSYDYISLYSQILIIVLINDSIWQKACLITPHSRAQVRDRIPESMRPNFDTVREMIDRTKAQARFADPEWGSRVAGLLRAERR